VRYLALWHTQIDQNVLHFEGFALKSSTLKIRENSLKNRDFFFLNNESTAFSRRDLKPVVVSESLACRARLGYGKVSLELKLFNHRLIAWGND